MNAALIMLGVGLIGLASYVLAYRERIMDRYRKNHTPPDSLLIRKLTAPSERVYLFNIRVLWPLIFLLGFYVFFAGVGII